MGWTEHSVCGLTAGPGADGQWLTPDVTSLAASAIGNPYLFTGRRYDPETRTAGHSGLYYYRARVYHPDLMRFCQPDPIGYADGLNLYQYCRNNPIVNADALGLCGERPWYRRIGASVVLPGGSMYMDNIWGGAMGHELIWVPGEGWKSYIYYGVGRGVPGAECHVGAGPVFNITHHDQYLGDYWNLAGMSPTTTYGAFGLDVSSWPNGPTAIHVNWGVTDSFSGSFGYQYYVYSDLTESREFARTVRAILQDRIPSRRQVNQLLTDIEAGGWDP